MTDYSVRILIYFYLLKKVNVVSCYCTVELKAEVEKLRAAQMSSQGVEPERVRLFQQEISALRNKLCQQEREMLEANRFVSQQKVTVYMNLNQLNL